MKLILAGGSGQIGHLLKRYCAKQGWQVVSLTRTVQEANDVFWDGQTLGAWTEYVDGADVLVNLAGRSVNCRYTADNRQQMMESRVHTTKLLGQAIHKCQRPPAVWLQSSTATIYDHTLDHPNDEVTGVINDQRTGAQQSWNFSVQIGKAWERTAQEHCPSSTRLVCLRTAMVMSPDRGGVFDTLRTLCRRGLGGASGDGQQYVSWIHEIDFVRAMHFLIEQTHIQGAVNMCAPEPIPNVLFMKEIRQAIGVPFGLPAARWMLEIGAVLMRTETELVLKSRYVVPRRLQEHGFRFEYPRWKEAVRELVCR